VLVTLATDPALAAEVISATEKYQWLVWVGGILVRAGWKMRYSGILCVEE